MEKKRASQISFNDSNDFCSSLRELFSPSQKSDCSSVQPSSVNSESVRSNTSSAFDLNSRPAAVTGKLRRMASFDSNKLLQINVGAVDKKGLKAKAATNVLTAKRKTGKMIINTICYNPHCLYELFKYLNN